MENLKKAMDSYMHKVEADRILTEELTSELYEICKLVSDFMNKTKIYNIGKFQMQSDGEILIDKQQVSRLRPKNREYIENLKKELYSAITQLPV